MASRWPPSPPPVPARPAPRSRSGLRRLGAWCLALACVPAASAFDFSPEAGRPVLLDFRPTDYQGHPQVFSIATGPQGFVYFGNLEGMLEFDGVRWTHHPAPTTLVYRLVAGSDRRLWVGGSDELGYYEPHAGGWRYVSIDASLPDGYKPTGRTTALAEFDGAAWFGTDAGIVRWQDGRARVWPDRASRWKGFAVVDGTLFVHRGQSGLWRYDGRDLVLVSAADEFRHDTTALLLRTAPGRSLWAIAYFGVFWLDHATGRLTREPGFLDDFVRGVRLHSGLRLHDGTVVLGTSGRGALLISPDGTRYRVLDRTSGLADNVVLSLAEDRNGGLWLGFNSGAARIDLASPVTVFDAGNGPTPGTADAWGRHRGRMYLGTFDGVYRLDPGDPSHGTGAHFTRVSEGLGNVFGFESLGDDLVVACGLGLVRLRDDRGYDLLVGTRPNNPYWLLHSKLVPTRYYLGGQRGLTVVEHTGDRWIKVAERLDLGDVHNLVEEPDGTLWLSTYSRGFWRVPQAAAITDWSAAPCEHYFRNCGLPAGFTWTAVTEGFFGPVFFTNKGAARFDLAQRRFEPEDRYVVDGSRAPMLTPTALDASGALWAAAFRTSTIAASSPLGRFPRDGRGRIWQSAPAGALREVGFAGAAAMYVDRTASDEFLWTRGYENVIRLDLHRVDAAAKPWLVYIRGIRSSSRTLAPPADGRPFAIPFSREPLAFDFASPRFASGRGLQFQFRLLGYDASWSDWTTLAGASFTNLEGGPFTLEVRARDIAGSVSESADLTFSIPPPWPRTTGAYVVYAVLALGAIAGFVRWRLQRAERERRRLEQLVARRTAELAAANNAKSVFLANMSHELRTPLNGILGYTQVLGKSAELGGRDRDRVAVIAQSGEHLLRMINEVLDFSKIEAGKLELRAAPFHLPQLLRDIAVALEPRAAQKQLRFALDAAADLPVTVIGDAQKLRQVLDNLLGNAVKFTLRGEIVLRVHRSGDHVAFAVEDTGVGIAEADQAGLFQPFHQPVDGRPPEPGTGLGLAIAKRLVELMGGALQVESAPGRGSVFSFSLPLEPLATDDAAAAVRPARPPIGYAGPRRRLMIVDDVAINRAVLTELLRPLGFELAECGSGAEALAALPRFRPDLVFLDLRMPGMSGLEFAAKVRADAGPRPVLVAMSASVLSFNRDKALAAGCDDFLAKPFRESDLIAKLAMHLSLQWEYAAASPGSDEAATPVCPAGDLLTLLEIARRGEIRHLREQLADLRARHPADPRLRELEVLAREYQMERIRAQLEAFVHAAPPAP